MAIDLAKCRHYRIFSSSGNVPQFSFLFLNNGNLKILCTVTFLILFLMISSESHYKCIRQSNSKNIECLMLIYTQIYSPNQGRR